MKHFIWMAQFKSGWATLLRSLYTVNDGVTDHNLQDIEQRILYDELKVVTRGPLFTIDRWRAILHLNGIIP